MDLKDIFNTDQVPQLVKGKLLKEKDLLTEPVDATATASFPIKTSAATFSIGASSQLRVALFNDIDDPDEANIINSDDPLIAPDYSTSAALKYYLTVKAKANGAGTLKDIGFDLDAEGLIETGLYTTHPNDEKIRDAVLKDLSSFPVIFRFEDISNLEAGKTLYLRSAGRLSAKMAVSWSDIFSKSIGKLAELIPEELSVDISIGASASATFDISVTDDFLYAVQKQDNGKLLVKIYKSDTTETSGKVSASVGASFADPDQLYQDLNKLADKFAESVTGKSTELVNELIEKSKANQLTAEESAYLQEITNRLGIEGENLTGQLTDRLDKLREQAKSIISTVATASVNLSFSYEYKRISTSQELLQAVFEEEVLSAYHDEFLRFKLKNFLGKTMEAGGSIAGVEVQQYLHEKQITTNKSWGFGFSVAGKGFSGRDFENIDRVVRKNILEKQQVVIDITRGYESKWFGTNVSWLGNLNAEMDGFSVLDHPTMREFDYSLYLNMNYVWRPDEKKLREFLDLGVLWQAVAQDETDRLVLKYGDQIYGSNATCEARLAIPDSVMRPLIHQIARNGLNDQISQLLAESFASAMSYWDRFEERQIVQRRQEIYTSLWKYYLDNPKRSPSHYANVATATLVKTIGNNSLSKGETNFYQTGGSEYYASLISSHKRLFSDTKHFIKGFTMLSNALSKNALYDGEFVTAYKSISQFFDQSYYVRAAGAFLTKLINANPLWKDQYERVLTITYGEGDNEQVINIGGVN
ncbi:MAG: hypothetical protein WBA74_10215 [Cyclobacteriaceae bacterium]